jgi:hypothetical protein
VLPKTFGDVQILMVMYPLCYGLYKWKYDLHLKRLILLGNTDMFLIDEV